MPWTQTNIADKRVDLFDPDAERRPEFGVLFLHPHRMRIAHR